MAQWKAFLRLTTDNGVEKKVSDHWFASNDGEKFREVSREPFLEDMPVAEIVGNTKVMTMSRDYLAQYGAEFFPIQVRA